MSAPARRARARRGDGELLHAELLVVAEALLVEAGEAGVTIRAVAARAGVSTPSVYLHFADKAALLDAVALAVWGQLGRLMDAAANQTPDPFEALRLRGRAYVRFGREHPAQYRLLMMQPRGDSLAAGDCFAHIVQGVQACVDAGVMRGDPRPLALGLWAAAHGVTSLLIAQPGFPWPADLDTFIDHTLRMAGMGSAVMSRVHAAPRNRSHALPALLDDFARTLNNTEDTGDTP